MIRAVLDTNVVVSGILKKESPPGRLLEALFEGRFVAVTAPPLLEELVRVLAYPRIRQKYRIREEESEAVVAALTLLADLVELPKVSWRASRDPDDDLFLVCALKGGAESLVTGDQDLLTLGSFRGIELVTADAFLKLLKA